MISFELETFTRAYTKALKVLQTAADAAEKLKTFELEHFDANSTVQEFKAAHGLIENIFKSPDLKVSCALYMTEFLSIGPFCSSRTNGIRRRIT